ncbi:TPA: DUF551 domain-containing protein [Enterobacter hormaechei]
MSNIDKHAVQAVADLKAGYTLGHADVAILNELARITLASIEAEPVGYMNRFTGRVFTLEEQPGADTDAQVYVPLYTAPPAPVVPGEWERWIADAVEYLEGGLEADGELEAEGSIEAKRLLSRRAAMLQGADGTLTNEGTIPVTQFKPVADLYGLTSPTGGETSFTFDAVEARDFIDGGWLCQEYVELGRFQEAMLQNGNSPAQSDCCPEQNYIAPAQDGDSPVIPDGWIPVSERMPGSQEWVIVFAKWDNQQVLCWDDVANRWTDFEDQSYYADMFTHWMPLPAAPQQEA